MPITQLIFILMEHRKELLKKIIYQQEVIKQLKEELKNLKNNINE